MANFPASGQGKHRNRWLFEIVVGHYLPAGCDKPNRQGRLFSVSHQFRQI